GTVMLSAHAPVSVRHPYRLDVLLDRPAVEPRPTRNLLERRLALVQQRAIPGQQFGNGQMSRKQSQRRLVLSGNQSSPKQLIARARTIDGMLKPSNVAVLRLIAISNFVGNSTGRSAGFAPCSILCTKLADR